MTGSIDPFFSRRRRPDYDCLDFARDVWLAETGDDLRDRLGDLMATHVEGRRVSAREFRLLRRLDGPMDPCLVIMRRPRTEPHMGVFLRGRVLHLGPRQPEFLEPRLASRGYTEVMYYQ